MELESGLLPKCPRVEGFVPSFTYGKVVDSSRHGAWGHIRDYGPFLFFSLPHRCELMAPLTNADIIISHITPSHIQHRALFWLHISLLSLTNTVLVVSVCSLQSQRFVLDNLPWMGPLLWDLFSKSLKSMHFYKSCQLPGVANSPSLWENPYVDLWFEGQLCLCGHQWCWWYWALSFYLIHTSFYLLHPLAHSSQPLSVFQGREQWEGDWQEAAGVRRKGVACVFPSSSLMDRLAASWPQSRHWWPFSSAFLGLVIPLCFFRIRSCVICGGSQLFLFLSPALALVATLFIEFTLLMKVKYSPFISDG